MTIGRPPVGQRREERRDFVVFHPPNHSRTRHATTCDIVATRRKGSRVEQPPLIVESLNEAVKFSARAIGFEKVANELWPAKGAKEAARYLNDCLNPERPHKLSGEEILHIARRGREIGCYLITSFINMDTGFGPPTPVDPDDEKAELQRQFIETGKRMEALLARISRSTER